MAYIYSLADTWADGATTFKGISLNVTDTASAAGSLLMDLQVGGVSLFSVRKNGTSFLSALSIAGGAYGGDGNWWSGNNLNIASASVLSFGPADTVLRRDAANTLAQRNGVNAQAFNLYNSFTDASNYERGFMRWVSGVLEIGTDAGGTGSNRQLRLLTTSSIAKTAGGSNYALEAGAYVRYASGVDLLWSNSTNAHTGLTTDVGIVRSSAGVLQITNGSTGTGQLIFIVPTTDPGITGALWNNAGTLAISA